MKEKEIKKWLWERKNIKYKIIIKRYFPGGNKYIVEEPEETNPFENYKSLIFDKAIINKKQIIAVKEEAGIKNYIIGTLLQYGLIMAKKIVGGSERKGCIILATVASRLIKNNIISNIGTIWQFYKLYKRCTGSKTTEWQDAWQLTKYGSSKAITAPLKVAKWATIKPLKWIYDKTKVIFVGKKISNISRTGGGLEGLDIGLGNVEKIQNVIVRIDNQPLIISQQNYDTAIKAINDLSLKMPKDQTIPENVIKDIFNIASGNPIPMINNVPTGIEIKLANQYTTQLNTNLVDSATMKVKNIDLFSNIIPKEVINTKAPINIDPIKIEHNIETYVKLIEKKLKISSQYMETFMSQPLIILSILGVSILGFLANDYFRGSGEYIQMVKASYKYIFIFYDYMVSFIKRTFGLSNTNIISDSDQKSIPANLENQTFIIPLKQHLKEKSYSKMLDLLIDYNRNNQAKINITQVDFKQVDNFLNEISTENIALVSEQQEIIESAIEKITQDIVNNAFNEAIEKLEKNE